MPQPIDTQMAAIASGDPEAMSLFYRDHFDWVYAQARRATGRDEAFCLDAVQEVMVKVIRRTPRISSEPELLAWLGRAVLTTSYDLIKGESRRTTREVSKSRQTPEHDAGGNQASMDQAERTAWLRTELAELDPGSLWLIEARHRLGWTLSRIGAALGIKTGAVDRKLRTLTGELQARAREVFDE